MFNKINYLNFLLVRNNKLNLINNKMGIGDWGLGLGDRKSVV